jgi:anti-anti-sigma factor
MPVLTKRFNKEWSSKMFNFRLTTLPTNTNIAIAKAGDTRSAMMQQLAHKGLMLGVGMEQDTVQLHLVGKLTAANSLLFKTLVKTFIANGYTSFVFDLSSLKHLDSAGVAALVNVRNAALEVNGEISVTNPDSELYRKLVAINFHHLIQIENYSFAA